VTAAVACQRWREGGLFNPAGYGVDVISDADAKTFVESRHYSGSYVAAVLRYGLFDRTGPQPVLVGAAILSDPTNVRVLTNVFPHLEPYRASLELGRFCLTQDVAFNGESWFLCQAFRLAHAAGLRGVVSFSDPVARHAWDGTLVKPGHIGIIYQAANSTYLGLSTARSHLLLPDGTVFDNGVRAGSWAVLGYHRAASAVVVASLYPRRCSPGFQELHADAASASCNLTIYGGFRESRLDADPGISGRAS
jgi:hypothetical protein